MWKTTYKKTPNRPGGRKEFEMKRILITIIVIILILIILVNTAN